MRMRIGRELLFRIVLCEHAALQAVVCADGRDDHDAVGVFKAQPAVRFRQRAALVQDAEAPFELYAIIGHLAGHDGGIALDMNLAALGIALCAFLDEGNHRPQRERNFPLLGRFMPHDQHAVGIAGEYIAPIAYAGLVIKHARHALVQIELAPVIGNVFMAIIDHQLAEIVQPAALAGIAQAVFGDLQAFDLCASKHVHAHIAVADGQRPLFPAVHGVVVYMRRRKIVDLGRAFRIPESHRNIRHDLILPACSLIAQILTYIARKGKQNFFRG